MKNKMKYKVGDIIVVQKGVPLFPNGAVAEIFDRDPIEGHYFAIDLSDIKSVVGRDLTTVINSCKWVKPDQIIQKISFEPKRNIWKLVTTFIKKFLKLSVN